MKTGRPLYVLAALVAGSLELLLCGTNDLPITWAIGLLCLGGSLVAQMIGAVVGTSAFAAPRGWSTSLSGAVGSPVNGSAKAGCAFDDTANGRGGINAVFSADDPFGEFL